MKLDSDTKLKIVRVILLMLSQFICISCMIPIFKETTEINFLIVLYLATLVIMVISIIISWYTIIKQITRG